MLALEDSELAGQLAFAVDTSSPLPPPFVLYILGLVGVKPQRVHRLTGNRKLAVREAIPNEISYGFAESLARNGCG